ncbi:hypothetical protein B296_00054525 [Ensete ventricosum]|uniref:Uncharacterized protein n=1 Tax=Ensete ventricosum TaxID=4639 RepID=A0A426X3L5_ENSVE|nr:hypothetical protein B296_00054525 [Ensete ventricosum]
MATNTPLSVYKPLHEYRILRVSNSPHLYELCITLSVVEQHISLCTVSSFTKRPAGLEHRQVWSPTPSRSSNLAIPTFVRVVSSHTGKEASPCPVPSLRGETLVSTVPIGSGRYAYRYPVGSVRIAHTGRYSSKRKTLHEI